MHAQSVILKLGQAQWTLRPLTLRQVRQIEPLLLADPQAKGGSIANAIEIIAIALQRDHADVVAGLPEIEASVQEISTAMSLVLQIGGFIRREEAQVVMGEVAMGEATAGVD